MSTKKVVLEFRDPYIVSIVCAVLYNQHLIKILRYLGFFKKIHEGIFVLVSFETIVLMHLFSFNARTGKLVIFWTNFTLYP